MTAARYEISVTGQDWSELARRNLDRVVVDPLVYRIGQFFLEGRDAGADRWPVIANDLGSLVTFFDLVVLHDQLPAFNYPDTYDVAEQVYRDRLGSVLNAGDKTLVHVDVEYVLYRTAKEAALRQIDSRLDGGAFVPSGIADAIVAMLDSTGYEWQPSLEQVDHRLPDDRDKKLARFLLGQLVFTGYAQQQANAVHVLSPQRSRVLGAVGLSGRAWQASASEGAIFAEIARRCSAGGEGWRDDEYPWTPSFLPYLLTRMGRGRAGPDVLLQRAKDLRATKAVGEYRALRAELAGADRQRSVTARRALEDAADKIADDLDCPRQDLEVLRPVAVGVLPKSIAAAVGAVAGGAAGGPVGAVAGAAAGATVEELLKQVNTRLWGWVVEGLALRSAQKLLSRSVMAEQELRGRLGSRLEQIWMTGRA